MPVDMGRLSTKIIIGLNERSPMQGLCESCQPRPAGMEDKICLAACLIFLIHHVIWCASSAVPCALEPKS